MSLSVWQYSRTKLGLLVLLTFGLFVTGCARDAKELLGSAKRYIQEHKYNDAIIELKSALNASPNLTEAYYQLGIAYASLGQLAQASQVFAKAITLDPTYTQAQLKYGNLLLLERKFDEARAKAESVLARDPANTTAQFLLGSSYAGVMHLNDSIQELRRAFEIDPRLLPPYLDLSAAGNFQPQMDLAEQAYQKVLTTTPRSVEAHIDLGNLQLREQHFAEAEEEYRAALAIEPASTDAQRALAFLYMQDRKQNLAEQLYIRLADSASADPGPRLVLADFYAGTEKPERSMDVLRKTIEANPKYGVAKKRLASLLLTQKRFDEAIQLANNVLQLDGNDPEARLIKGRVSLAQNRVYDAIADLQQVVKTRPGFSLGHYYLGIAYAQTDDSQKAEAELLSAVQNDQTFLRAYIPLAELKLNAGLADVAIRYARQALTDASLSQAHLILARAYINQKAFNSAAQEIDEFLKKSPGTPPGAYHLGLLRFAQGDFGQAEAALDAALKASPDSEDSLSLLATVDLRLNRPQNAIDRINLGISHSPNNAGLYRVLARAYQSQQDYAKAEQAYLKAVSIAPADTRLRLEMAEFYSQTGAPQKSIDTIQAVISDERGNIRARRQLAAVYLSANDYPNALKIADDLIQRSSTDTDALILKGRILMEMGKRTDAIAHLMDLTRKAPASAPARYYLGLAYSQDGDSRAAEQKWIEAAKIAGTFPSPLVALGQLKLDSGDLESAARYARQALLADPVLPEANLVLALATRASKDLKAAAAILEDAVKRNPADALGHQRLGLLYLEQGMLDPANIQFESALKTAPNSKESMSGLIRIYQEKNRPQQAVARVMEQIGRSSSPAAFWDLLGQVYVDQKDMVKAEESYRKAVDIAPGNAEAEIALSNFYVAAGLAAKAVAVDESRLMKEPQNAALKRRLAGLYLTQKSFDRATPLVDELIKADAQDSEARLLKGRVLLGQGKVANAITELQAAVNINPSSAPARLFLGRAYSQDSKPEQAEAAWMEALKIDGRLAEAHLALAQSKLQSGNAAPAMLEATEALKVNPRLSEALLVLGNAQMLKKDFSGAAGTFQKLVSARPGNPIALDRLGSAVAAQGDLVKAESYFIEGLRTNPDNLDLLSHALSNYVNQRKPEKAIELVNQYIMQHPREAKAYELLGQVYLSQKEFGKAEAAYRKALASNSNNFEAYTLLGQLFLAQKALDRALTEFENALKVDPKSVSAHVILGVVQEMKGNPQQAEVHYREALRLDPQAAVAANNLAWLLAESDKNIREAATLARLAVEKLPELPNVMDTMGWIYYKSGAYSSAVDVLTKSVQKAPANPTYHYHLGMSYYKLGNLDKAKTFLSGAIKLDPAFHDVDEAKRTLASLARQ